MSSSLPEFFESEEEQATAPLDVSMPKTDGEQIDPYAGMASQPIPQQAGFLGNLVSGQAPLPPPHWTPEADPTAGGAIPGAVPDMSQPIAEPKPQFQLQMPQFGVRTPAQKLPGYLSKLGQIGQETQGVIDEQADAVTQTGEIQQRGLLDQKGLLELQAAETDRTRVKAQQRRQTLQTAIDKASEDILSTEIQANPQLLSRRERATWLGVIGKSLGALGAMLRGQQSDTLAAPIVDAIWQKLDNEIVRDINLQRQNLDNKRSGLTIMQQKMQNLREAIGDDRAWMQQVYLLKLQAQKTNLDSMLAKTQSQKEAAGLRFLGKEWDAKIAQAQAGIAQHIDSLSFQRAAMQTKQQMEAAKAVEKRRISTPELIREGPRSIKLGEAEAGKLRSSVTDSRGAVSNIDQILQILEQTSKLGRTLDRETAGTLESLSGQVTAFAKSEAFANLGAALNAQEKAILDQITGDPTQWMTQSTQAQLRNFRNALVNRTVNKLQSVGRGLGPQLIRDFRSSVGTPTRR